MGSMDAIGDTGVVIQVDNYIVSRDCGKSVDVDVLAEYGDADIDMGFCPAKFRVSRPASTGRKDEKDTVNVYPSGKIVVLGTKSIERAKTDMRMVLRKLGGMAAVAEAEAGDAAPDGEGGGDGRAAPLVRFVVMSGCIFGGYDARKAIPLLEREYEVSIDSDVFSGYFLRSREGNVSVQVFAEAGGAGGERGGGNSNSSSGGGSGSGQGGAGMHGPGRTPLLCRGPTVQDIRRVVGDVYRMIVEANGGASVATATEAEADGAGAEKAADGLAPSG